MIGAFAASASAIAAIINVPEDESSRTLLLVLGAAGLASVAGSLFATYAKDRAEDREWWSDMLARTVRTKKLKRASIYELGVEFETRDALAAIGIKGDHAPYCARDEDQRLRESIDAALGAPGVTIVVVQGASGAGKTRAALDSVLQVERGWLLVPHPPARDPGALSRLAEAGPPRRRGPFIIWIDDIEEWVRPGGLAPDTYGQLARWRKPVLVLATAFGKGMCGDESRSRTSEWGISNMLKHAVRHDVPSLPSTEELSAIRRRLGTVAASKAQEHGLGSFLIGGPRLVQRLQATSNQVGRAAVHAAIDCRRAGVVHGIPLEWLRVILKRDFRSPLTEQMLTEALTWATEDVCDRTALLYRDITRLNSTVFRPDDYAVEYRASVDPAISSAVWNTVISRADIGTLGSIASAADGLGYKAAAFKAARRADALGSASGAFMLGMLQYQQGDTLRAIAGWERAERRGDAKGAYWMGLLHLARDDEAAANVSLRRADERGSIDAAIYFGCQCWKRGDNDEAARAFRRAEERGSAEAAVLLGEILGLSGDHRGKKAAYLRADARGYGGGAYAVGVELWNAGDSRGAIAAWRRADERGDPDAAWEIGVMHLDGGDFDEAEAAFVRADERGSPEGSFELGIVLVMQGKTDEAERAFARAREQGITSSARSGVMKKASRRPIAIAIRRLEGHWYVKRLIDG